MVFAQIGVCYNKGDLSVILMQRRFDYQRGVAEVNMARMRPGKERKVLLTATHYRLFGVDDQFAATACLRSYLKGRGVHSIAYTDDTLPSLNDLAEDVLYIADDGLVLVANQENKLLVNALACRIAQLEDLPIYLLYGGSELNCQAEETVTTIVDGAPEETLTELLGAAEGQPLMKCSPDAQRAALQHIQQRCRERDVLLVADEVATGFGRTGTPLRLAAGGDHPRPGLPVQGHQQRLPGGGTGDVPQGDRPEPAPLPGAADQSIQRRLERLEIPQYQKSKLESLSKGNPTFHDVLQKLVEAQVPVDALERSQESLQEIFLNLVGEEGVEA